MIGSPSARQRLVDDARRCRPCAGRGGSRCRCAKISAICVATASGMPASSVAANSEERTVPLASSGCAVSGASTDVGDQLAVGALDAQARELGRNLVVARRGIAGDQLDRACRAVSTRTWTRLPARPFEQLLARSGRRAGRRPRAASVTPSRASSESAVSLARVTSLRKSVEVAGRRGRRAAPERRRWRRSRVTVRCGSVGGVGNQRRDAEGGGREAGQAERDGQQRAVLG